MHFLYRITDVLNNKVYIGQTINPARRWSYHKSQSKKIKPLQYIHRAMTKYGIDNFVFDVIVSCITQDDADYTEIQLIERYDSRNKEVGYNRAPGGSVAWESGLPSYMYSMFGKHHSEKSKQQIRNALIGNAPSANTKSKMSMAAIKRNVSDSSNKRTTGQAWKNMGRETAEKIRFEYRNGGVSFTQLAAKYDRSVGNISLIVNNKIHKNKL